MKFERVYPVHRCLSDRRTGIAFGDLLDELREGDRDRLGWSKTTLQRTLNFLRYALHAPLVREHSTGRYRYDKTSRYELPGVWFTAQELAALLVLEEVLRCQPLGILSEVLRPARKQLDDLRKSAKVGMPDWHKHLRLLRMAARPPGEHFAAVADALARRRRVRIEYHARGDDRWSDRIVSPQRLTLYRDNWYLDAWCHLRKDLRSFSLDRIVACETLNQAARKVAERHLDQTLATSYGIFAGTPTATAELHFNEHAARWAVSETWHPKQQDTRHEDGSLTRAVPYHRSEELVMDILRYGPDLQVLAPETLKAEVARRLTAALAQYAPPPATRRNLKKAGQRVDLRKKTSARSQGSGIEPAAGYAGLSIARSKSRQP